MDPEDERHGTTAGYKAHHVAGEKACDACRAAHNEHRTKLKRKASGRCVDCGRARADRRPGRGVRCHDCETAGAVRPTDLDIDFDPPNWVRRGLIWVAA